MPGYAVFGNLLVIAGLAVPVALAEAPRKSAPAQAACVFPDEQAPAPAWICEREFPDRVSMIGESRRGEKEARADAVAQFRALVATHLMNLSQESPEVQVNDASARKKLSGLIRDTVSAYPFESRLETLGKTRSKGGVSFVAVGAPIARVDEFVGLLMKQVLAEYKKTGRGAR